MLHEVKRRSAQFDFLHFHRDLGAFCDVRTAGPQDCDDVARAPGISRTMPPRTTVGVFRLVSISDQQRKPLLNANWLATVPHGVPLCQYAFPRASGRSVSSLSWTNLSEKRPGRGRSMSHADARIPLKLAAKVDAVDTVYVETVVKPLLDDPGVEFVGEIGDERKSEFLGNALALLSPVHWPEPFGLVMIEAMACGTPVIAGIAALYPR